MNARFVRNCSIALAALLLAACDDPFAPRGGSLVTAAPVVWTGNGGRALRTPLPAASAADRPAR